MATTRFLQYKVPKAQSSTAELNKTLQDVFDALKSNELQDKTSLVIGTQVGEESTIQIAAQDDPPSFSEHRRNHIGASTLGFHVKFNKPTFGPTGALAKPVTEFVFNWFPISQTTPDFRKKIEGDFDRFDNLAGFPDADGDNGRDVAYGWVDEEQDHEEVKGEKTKVFVIARGWESMEAFGKFMQTDKAKEHLPILMAWGAPFKMWHIDRKAGINADGVS